MEKEKVIKRIKENAQYMASKLKFNEVHIESYTNSRGKTLYKGKIRVHDMEITFTDLSFYDIDNIFEGIMLGYAFALKQIVYDTKK